MLYLQLFWSFFLVGLFSIGGGYAALPLIQSQVVEQHGWLSMTEFADVVTISQMTPGPISLNAATFVGAKLAGLGGSVIATAGCVMPSFIIVLTLAYFYSKYKELPIVHEVLSRLRPAVVALIASAGLSIFVLTMWQGKPVAASVDDISYISAGIFAIGLIVLRKVKCNPMYVIMGAGIMGAFAFWLI